MTIEDVGRILVLVLAVALVSACGDDDGESGAPRAQQSTTDGAGAAGSSGAGLSAEVSESIVHHLETLETAYVGGDPEGARAHLDEAVAEWSEASSSVPEDQAGQIQLQLDSLSDAVDSASPPVAISGSVGSLSAALAPAPAGTGGEVPAPAPGG